jgi:DNA-binding MarR family transcriptional regulator
MEASEQAFGSEEGFPTEPLGWLLALGSRVVKDGLSSGFSTAGINVTPEQWSILANLWYMDGVSQQVLADRFHRSKVAAFHLITKLEEQGLVVRRTNPADGRSNLIYLTPEGRAVVTRLIPVAEANLDRALKGVPERDVKTAESVIRRVIFNMMQ